MEVRSRRPNEPAQITAAKFGSRILTIEAGGEAMLPLAINPLIPSDHVESRGYGYGRVGVTLSMGEKLLQRRARALQRQHQTRYPSIVAQDGNVTAGLIMSAAAALDLLTWWVIYSTTSRSTIWRMALRHRLRLPLHL